MTTVEPVRFGLIGAGGIGAVRARAFEKSPDAALTAAFDLDADRARALAGNPHTFLSLQQFFESDAFDAVAISTPPNTHRDLAIEAMRHGKHVLVEKPMAESLDACNDMIEASRRANRVLAVGFNHRFFKGVQVVRDAIRSGRIGRLSWVRAFAGHTGLTEFKSPWMYDKSVMGGGTLMDNGVHVLDLVNHLMSDIQEVSCVTRNDIWKLDVEDNAFAHFVDDNGTVCDLHASWTEWKGYRFFVEAYGDRGMTGMYYAPMQSRVTLVDEDGVQQGTKRQFFVRDMFREKFLGWQSTVIDTFVDETRDFVSRLRADTRPLIAADAHDGLMACALANAAFKSSDLRRSVKMSELIVQSK